MFLCADTRSQVYAYLWLEDLLSLTQVNHEYYNSVMNSKRNDREGFHLRNEILIKPLQLMFPCRDVPILMNGILIRHFGKAVEAQRQRLEDCFNMQGKSLRAHLHVDAVRHMLVNHVAELDLKKLPGFENLDLYIDYHRLYRKILRCRSGFKHEDLDFLFFNKQITFKVLLHKIGKAFLLQRAYRLKMVTPRREFNKTMTLARLKLLWPHETPSNTAIV